MSNNKFRLIGKVKEVPTTKTLDNDKTITTLTITADESYEFDGERRELFKTHKIETWGHHFDGLLVGSKVQVEGKIVSREVESKRTGDLLSIVSLTAKKVELLSAPTQVEQVAQVAPKGLPF